ncbi:MAG: exodeoxyribonuclease III [Vampirovibrionales bacterium]
MPTTDTSNTRCLISWNVNGLRASLKKGLLDWVQTAQPDILCLQETKLQGHQLTFDMIHPPGGYYTYYSHATRPGYSGVAIWSKEKPLRVQEGFGVEAFDSEGRTLIAEYPNFILYATYYPNGTSGDTRLQYKMDFYKAFLDGHLKPLLATGKPIVLTGDFNTAHHAIDLARPKDNEGTSGFLPIERAWMDDLVAAGFVDTFRHLHPNEPDRYSWWAMRSRARERNVGWRIDYFFATQNLVPHITNADILHTVEGSDHAPVLLELSC